MIRRCTECGSWEAQCDSETPVPGCGCARCRSFEMARLAAECDKLRTEAAVELAKHGGCIDEQRRDFEEALEQQLDLRDAALARVRLLAEALERIVSEPCTAPGSWLQQIAEEALAPLRKGESE